MQIILLSGGSGKRLWPLSNNTRSKQFIKLLTAPDGSKESMVQRVVRQLRETGICDSITVATSQSQRDIIINQLGEEIPVVTEPERRDTFPAIALASSYLAYKRKCSTDEIIIVMPCDPYTETGYFETIRRIADAVKNNVAELVLMGINPTYPSAKYGYVVPANDVQRNISSITLYGKARYDNCRETYFRGCFLERRRIRFSVGVYDRYCNPTHQNRHFFRNSFSLWGISENQF